MRRTLAPWNAPSRIGLALDYAPHLDLSDVPDPYYGDLAGFERVLDLCVEASRGLIEAYRDGRRRVSHPTPD